MLRSDVTLSVPFRGHQILPILTIILLDLIEDLLVVPLREVHQSYPSHCTNIIFQC